MRSRLLVAGLTVVSAGSAMLAVMTAAAGDEPRARVEYDPPRLSVAATEVTLGELLRLIGAQVGFTVAEGPGASRRVTVSIESSSVDDALRQLLRAENHTILYRKDADSGVMVDRIVLLGAPADGVPVADTRPRPGQGSAAVASETVTSPQASPAPSAGAVPTTGRAGEGATTEEPPVSVGDMLRSHALAGLPPPAETVAEAPPPSVPPSLEESLAITTQRAQQGLTSLVEGLERATRSLQQPAPAPAR